ERGSCRRCRRVTLHEIPQRLPQRSEPLLVVPPLLDALGVERLADLFGADRAHDARVFVEPQALLLERQTAVGEELLQLAARIGYEPLVVEPMHPSRQHGVEMLHHAYIVLVVAAQHPRLVGEYLNPADELLL